MKASRSGIYLRYQDDWAKTSNRIYDGNTATDIGIYRDELNIGQLSSPQTANSQLAKSARSSDIFLGRRTPYSWRSSAVRSASYVDLTFSLHLRDMAELDYFYLDGTYKPQFSGVPTEELGSTSPVRWTSTDGVRSLASWDVFALSGADKDSILFYLAHYLADIHSQNKYYGCLEPRYILLVRGEYGDICAYLKNLNQNEAVIDVYYAPEVIKSSANRGTSADMYALGRVMRFLYAPCVPPALHKLFSGLSVLDPRKRLSAQEVLDFYSRTAKIIEEKEQEQTHLPQQVVYQAHEHTRVFVELEKSKAYQVIQAYQFSDKPYFYRHCEKLQFLLAQIGDYQLYADLEEEFSYFKQAMRYDMR